MRNLTPTSSYGYFLRISVSFLLVALSFLQNANSQESVRSSMAGSKAFHNLVQEVAGPSNGNARYNFRIGQSEWYLGARFSTEYNSNINLSQTNPLPDIILRPGLDLRVRWQATQRNYLAAKIGFEYDKYIFNPDYDQFNLGIDPDTVFEFTFFVKDFRIKFYDRPSTQRNAAQNSTLANVSNYSFLNNILGMSVIWDLNDLIFEAGIERNDQRSMNSNFEGLNNHGYLGYLTGSVKLNPTLFVGMRATVSNTMYESSVLNNNQGATLGVFAQGEITKYTGFRIEGGMQILTFSDTGLPPDNSAAVVNNPNGETNITQNSGGGNFIGPYLTMGMQNRLNNYITHGLALSLQATPGTTSDYVYISAINYNLGWNMNKKVNVSFSTFFQYGIQSGTEDAEIYEQYGATLRFNYYIVKYANIFTELGFIVRASDIDDRSYNQVRALLGLQYAF
ncbi:MAG: hypothetical protein ABI615_00775 [Chthoniobacterales bacterium]